MSILLMIVAVIYSLGWVIGYFIFKASKWRILISFVCGFGMLFFAAGIAFAGCIALFQSMQS